MGNGTTGLDHTMRLFYLCIALITSTALVYREIKEIKKINKNFYELNEITEIFSHIQGIYKYTIVVISFNRTKCLERVFNQLYYMENLPKGTEILITDDNTPSQSHKNYLINLSKNPRVTIVFNYGYQGAFYNKLNGFLLARGKYIMTCDDDDTFNTGFYSEMINNIEEKYDVVYSLYSVWSKKKFSSIEEMMIKFHNFCNIAFKKELILSIQYPKSVPIIRDDAPLIIPLYMKTNMNKIKCYTNKYKYIIDRYCDKLYKHKHQSYYFREQQYVINGMVFLIDYAEKQNQSHLIPTFRAAYRGYIKKNLYLISSKNRFQQ